MSKNEKKIKFIPNAEWRTLDKPDDTIDSDLVYNRQFAGLPRVKSHIIKKCFIPERTISVDHLGRVFLCSCVGWLPYPVGNVDDFESLDEIYSSPVGSSILHSIDTREYNFCATDLCGLDQWPTIDERAKVELSIFLTIDNSCNLSCPSCRERVILVTDGSIVQQRIEWVNKIYNWVNSSNNQVELNFGGGEVFASKVYKHILNSFVDDPSIKFIIQTNGLLLTRNKGILEKIKDRTALSVSIDAAHKDTYESVRRGGDWKTLIKNLEYIKSLNLNDPVTGNFVIQKANFRELPDFIELCRKYNLTPNLSLIEDWGTLQNFESHCVHYIDNEHYSEFSSIANSLDTFIRGWSK